MLTTVCTCFLLLHVLWFFCFCFLFLVSCFLLLVSCSNFFCCFFCFLFLVSCSNFLCCFYEFVMSTTLTTLSPSLLFFLVVPLYCSICRVNSTMKLVPLDANFVLKIPLPLAKIEKVHVNNVLLVVRLKMAAPNVPIAHRANLKTWSTTKKCVPTAPLALHRVTRTKKFVRHASKEKKHQRGEVVFVRHAIWVNSI